MIGLCLDSEVCQELRDHESEDDDIIDLNVSVWSSYASGVKQLLFELIHPVSC